MFREVAVLLVVPAVPRSVVESSPFRNSQHKSTLQQR